MNEEARKRIEENLRTKRTELDLSLCRLTGREPELKLSAGCSHLRVLVLRNNQISDISFLENLTGLTSLNLWKNKISDSSFLENLTGLRNLDLADNQISDFSFLENLTGLSSLHLDRNQISDISFLENLTGLTKLNLTGNQISDISLALLRQLPDLQWLQLHENPIQNIPKEIFDKYVNALPAVRNFLEDEQKGKAADREVKVLFVGNGSAGKTQIARRLALQKGYRFNNQHESTHGISLLQRKMTGRLLNLWDFGGQDLYHATHRLFMQSRALFVLVWDFENETSAFHEHGGRKYKNEKLRYWLEYIRAFGQGSPVLVLQNKVDREEDKSKTLLPEDAEKWEADFPIIKFLQVSAKKGRGFAVLEEVLAEAFEKNEFLPGQFRDLPKSWPTDLQGLNPNLAGRFGGGTQNFY